MLKKINLTEIGKTVKETLQIVRKELRHHFTNPSAYIVIIVFLGILEFLFFSTLLNVRLVVIRSLLDYIPWLFLFLIPAITMASFAQEKKEGTLEFYLTQPISEIQLLIGKFISSFLFLAVAILLTLPAVISVASYGTVDWGQITGQYVAMLTLGFAMTAMGTFMSALVSNQISAFLLTAASGFLFTIAGLEIVTQTLPLGIVAVVERIGLYSHFTAMSRGAIDLRDIVYFASFSAIFLTAAYLPLIKNKFGQKSKALNGLRALIVLLVTLGISVSILGEQIPGRIDLTQKRLYTLSDTTKNILADSDDIINITVYLSKQLPSQYQPHLRDVKDILRDYQSYGKGNVQVNYKYTDSEDVEMEALSAGIQTVQFNMRTNEEFTVSNGYLGILISYLDKREVISFVDDTSNLEYKLTGLISKVSTSEKPTIAFLSTGTEHSIYEDYSAFRSQLAAQFEVTSFELNDEQTELPENAKVIVLAGIKEELNDNAKNKLKEFMENGGAVFALVDSLTVDQQTLGVSVNEFSLAELFTDYGITINENMVYDLKYNEIVGSNGVYFQYPFWLKAIPNQENALTKDLDMITNRWASTLSVDENISDTEIENLLTTSEFAYYQSNGNFDITPQAALQYDEQTIGEQTLAVSYLKKLSEENSLRIIVATDSDLLVGSTEQQYITSNLQFGLNAVEWLAQNVSLAEIRTKDTSYSSLIFEQDWEANALKFGNIGGIILAVGIGGGVVLFLRRRKSQKEYTV